MSAVTSIAVHEAIAKYRRLPMGRYPFPDEEEEERILRRLDADRDGRVSIAFRRLEPARPVLVIFYLLQAVDIALSAQEMTADSDKCASEYAEAARTAAHLAEFCTGKAPLHLVEAQLRLAGYLKEQAWHYAGRPEGLQIKRTRKNSTAAALLALRHLAKTFREWGMRRLDHDALRWLVEAALDRPISEATARLALREEMRVESPGNGNELAKPM